MFEHAIKRSTELMTQPAACMTGGQAGKPELVLRGCRATARSHTLADMRPPILCSHGESVSSCLTPVDRSSSCCSLPAWVGGDMSGTVVSSLYGASGEWAGAVTVTSYLLLL